jgi:hypothetical protein
MVTKSEEEMIMEERGLDADRARELLLAHGSVRKALEND